MKPRQRIPLFLLETVCWSAAALCGALWLGTSLQARAARRTASVYSLTGNGGSGAPAQASGSGIRPASEQPVPSASSPGHPSSSSAVIGRLEIAQLALSVPLLASDTPQSLRLGVGHIPGTAVAGGLGTAAFAGHRDTFFRPLQRIAPGMDIVLTGPSGAFHYAVDSTEIVLPEQVDVIATRSRPELALVTCYPFDFIGAAPKRYIVHAHLRSVIPGV